MLSLAACAPTINAGNKNMVTLFVPSKMQEGEALRLADQHCAQFGRSATLKGKPRGDYYDYSCVK